MSANITRWCKTKSNIFKLHSSYYVHHAHVESQRKILIKSITRKSPKNKISHAQLAFLITAKLDLHLDAWTFCQMIIKCSTSFCATPYIQRCSMIIAVLSITPSNNFISNSSQSSFYRPHFDNFLNVIQCVRDNFSTAILEHHSRTPS